MVSNQEVDRYTAITFAPVQGFIEKSRKLRDLYGSSYILSHLANTICKKAEEDTVRGLKVISPALIDVAKGTPNQILIRGDFPEQEAKRIFHQAWGEIVDRCRSWIETNLPEYKYNWNREWKHWRNYAWEFFWVQGETNDLARGKLNELKRSRAWIGINWKGESSTLSGADAIAYPAMDLFNPKTDSYQKEKETIEKFYRRLSKRVSEAIIDPREELSIPELIKRLVTLKEVIAPELVNHEVILRNANSPDSPTVDSSKIIKVGEVETPKTFQEVERLESEYWTGWFQGDGDNVGKYLKSLARENSDPDESTKKFSEDLRKWAESDFTTWVEKAWGRNNLGRVVYAGGDDFLGIFYTSKAEQSPDEQTEIDPSSALKPLTAFECLQRFYGFRNVWEKHGHGKGITASVGFVWAAHGVPQRDVLQHCREAEKTAKSQGRDRLAIRILFNSGNYLEWSCPWEFLEQILTGYCDRSGTTGQEANWTHLYNDIAVLESRHAFNNQSTDITLALWDIYFPDVAKNLNLSNFQVLWNEDDPDTKLRKRSGILGDQKSYQELPNQDSVDLDAQEKYRTTVNKALNKWFINLAKVGFHLCSNT